MKKSLAKLVLRKETLRALCNMNLARVLGGGDAKPGLMADNTHENVCPAAVALPKA